MHWLTKTSSSASARVEGAVLIFQQYCQGRATPLCRVPFIGILLIMRILLRIAHASALAQHVNPTRKPSMRTQHSPAMQ